MATFGMMVAALVTTAIGRPDDAARVGFIWHFPFVDVGTNLIGVSGGTSHIARVPWVAVQPEPDRWDFSALHRQIAEAEKGGFGIVLLLECNPFCAPAWLKKQVRDAGESVRDPAGSVGDIPSTTSRVFERAQRRFIERTLAEVRRRDTLRCITHYQVGVEWWFPFEWRHAPADIARFRAWLRRKYGAMDRLNRAWGADYGSFSSVEPPKLHVSGRLWERGRDGLIPVEAMPGAPHSQAAAYDWMTFWHETAATYIDRLAAIARRIDPSRPTMSFLTFSFAQGVEWDYVDWSAIRLDEVCARAKSIADIGMQLPAARGDPFRIAVGLDMARKYGKPMSVLDLLDFTDGVRAGRAVHERATHTAIQHGASALYYCCWNGAKDFNFHPDWPMEDIRGMLTGARQTLETVRRLPVVADGAIILPIMPGTPGTAEQRGRAAASFMGWYRLLRAMQRSVDVITFREIERGLNLRKYRWIVLPACELAPRSAAEVLSRLPRSVRLIMAGSGPSFDERGEPIRWTAPQAVGVRDMGSACAGPMVRDAAAGDTPPLVMWRRPEHEATLAEARQTLEALLPRADVGVDIPGAGPEVAATVRRSADRLAVHLVNDGDGNAASVTVAWPVAYCAAMRLYCDGQALNPETERSGPTLRVTLPAFRTYCLLVGSRMP